jgi:hypothetical protein
VAEESRRSGLFTVGGDVYGWADVVLLAKLRGEWSALAAQVRTGMAALAELEARGEELGEEEVEGAARAFRYDRDLLAADELAAWLDRHELTADDWTDYLCRALARTQLPEADGRVAEEEGEPAVWAEGICSGRFEQLARELAQRAAVSPGSPVERLDATFADFCSTAVDSTAEAREVEANRLEWLRFEYEAVLADDEGAAHEAVLCLRADGEALEAVAERAGLELESGDCWLDELDPALGTRFLAATAGDIVGPVNVENGFLVAHVTSKTAPSLDDADVRARAREAALARAVARMVADRVVWL